MIMRLKCRLSAIIRGYLHPYPVTHLGITVFLYMVPPNFHNLKYRPGSDHFSTLG
uniref:Uncharacterized protein n=2 Tax=Anguilla anguilla TaxID=7936 RepID=A0A0E9SSK1_ANGAN